MFKNDKAMLFQPVIVKCPNSRYNGLIGYVTGFWLDEDLGFEVLFEVNIHRTTPYKDSHGIEKKKVLYMTKIDLAIDEMEVIRADFTDVCWETGKNNRSNLY